MDSVEWRNWSNIHPYLCRHGVCLDDLQDVQKHVALALVRASLNAAGYATARNVMKLNEHIREITGRDAEYSEWYYWMSLFGTPSVTEPWGWQIDGHHLIINCFVLGDQLVHDADAGGGGAGLSADDLRDPRGLDFTLTHGRCMSAPFSLGHACHGVPAVAPMAPRQFGTRGGSIDDRSFGEAPGAVRCPVGQGHVSGDAERHYPPSKPSMR